MSAGYEVLVQCDLCRVLAGASSSELVGPYEDALPQERLDEQRQEAEIAAAADGWSRVLAPGELEHGTPGYFWFRAGDRHHCPECRALLDQELPSGRALETWADEVIEDMDYPEETLEVGAWRRRRERKALVHAGSHFEGQTLAALLYRSAGVQRRGGPVSDLRRSLLDWASRTSQARAARSM